MYKNKAHICTNRSGTRIYQPMDHDIFGIVKSKLWKESSKIKIDENRFLDFNELMNTI